MYYAASEGHSVRDVRARPDVVTMGINPTKAHLHDGHYLTMFQALVALDTHGKRHSECHIFVDDREFHTPRHAQDPTFRIPTLDDAQSMRITIRNAVEQITHAIGSPTLASRTTVQFMSEHMRENIDDRPVSQTLYRLLWDSRQEIQSLFEFYDEADHLRVLCDGCKTMSLDRRENMVYPKLLIGKTHDPLCRTGGDQYRASPEAGSTNWAMHYTVDPIRDALKAGAGQRVLHVFGGDYGIPWGRSGKPKARRLDDFMDNHHVRGVDYFVGPMLQRDGRKLAKSNGDAAFGIPSIEQLDQWAHAHSGIVHLPHTAQDETLALSTDGPGTHNAENSFYATENSGFSERPSDQ